MDLLVVLVFVCGLSLLALRYGHDSRDGLRSAEDDPARRGVVGDGAVHGSARLRRRLRRVPRRGSLPEPELAHRERISAPGASRSSCGVRGDAGMRVPPPPVSRVPPHMRRCGRGVRRLASTRGIGHREASSQGSGPVGSTTLRGYPARIA